MDGRVRGWVALGIAGLGACACPLAARERQGDWRHLATVADRARLRDWRDAWVAARAGVSGPAPRARMLAQGALLDPDHALDDPIPPAGRYRCRIVKIGSRMVGGDALRERTPVPCLVETDGAAIRFRMPVGPQRMDGRVFADSRTRGVLLGTLVLGDERRAMAYGRDATRDMAGLVERVDRRRWRLTLPYPRFESVLDVIELTPA